VRAHPIGCHRPRIAARHKLGHARIAGERVPINHPYRAHLAGARSTHRLEDHVSSVGLPPRDSYRLGAAYCSLMLSYVILHYMADASSGQIEMWFQGKPERRERVAASSDVAGPLVRELARVLPRALDDDALRDLAAKLHPHLADRSRETSGLRLMTAAEVAEHAHVHVETVRRAIRTGQLSAAARIGRSPRLAPVAVDSWLAATSRSQGKHRAIRTRRSAQAARAASAYSLRAALDASD
jgi:excisionase family DNA binding protein